MPLAKKLSKVSEKIAKSKGAVHPKGRKFKQLNRATNREERISRVKAKNFEKKQQDTLIYTFLQQVLQSRDEKMFSINEMKVFVEAFISRNDEEIESLKASRRQGRPASNRQIVLESKRSHENHLFQTGWDVPDLTSEENVKNIVRWNGSVGGLTNIKKILLKRDSAQDQEMST